MKTYSSLLLLFLIACSACDKPSEQKAAAPKPETIAVENLPNMKQVRRSFRDNYAATDNVEEKRRLANELIDQYAPELKPSFANFTGEGWDGALQAPGLEMMLSNCATKNRQRQGFILEVQAARDIAASGLRIVSCNDAIKRNGKRTILDILATDTTGQQYNFEVKDWKKSSFSLEAVPDLLDQLERQKAALPNAKHIFFYGRAEKDIPSGVRR